MLGGVRYNRTIEKLTVLTTLWSSHAAACVIMSAMSSCAALGNIVICWMNGSVHAAFRSTYQSPACHSGAAANMRATFPPCGLIPTTPGTFSFRRWTTAGPFALSSTITAEIGRCTSRCRLISASVANASRCLLMTLRTNLFGP